MLPLPRFYDPEEIGSLHLERAGVIAEEAERFAATHAVRPAEQDHPRIAALGLDVQVAFCTPGASLFVPGAVEDTRRTVEWIYRNLDRLSRLFLSMDTHRAFQIFHPAWWLDREGRHPPPFTPITAEEVRTGRWKPISHPDEALEYCEKLEASGKYVLTIWPYHALLGGLSHALEPALMEAALFHALVRKSPTHFETKGSVELTENYSVLAPEVRELGGQTLGQFDAALLEELLAYDRVYVFGQAKSHCVLATLKDMRAYLEEHRPALAERIYVLVDAMSPVPPPPIDPLPPALDFPRLAEEGIAELGRAGFRLVKTGDPI